MTTVTSSTVGREHVPLEQCFVLRAVDWPTYQKVSDALTGRHVRLTYDGENLEFMTISPEHANCSRLIARFVVVLTEELNVPLKSFGDMTCDREDAQRGLEPDECFYLEHEPLVRSKDRIDFAIDPPPDLAVEVEISRSSRNRMDIYAKLRMVEVWRYNGHALRVYQLTTAGTYAEADQSKYFPNVPIGQLASFLQRRGEVDENSLIRSFRTWVRDQITKSS
jgi:Uma2 family endonuclease